MNLVQQCGHDRYLFDWIFIHLTSGLKGWHCVFVRLYIPGYVCYVVIHRTRAVVKGTVRFEGEGEMPILIAVVTNLHIIISVTFCILIIWLQCNFNWCTHHEWFFSVSLLCAQVVEVQLALQSLPKEVLDTQGEAYIFLPISCLCLCYIAFVFFGFFCLQRW